MAIHNDQCDKCGRFAFESCNSPKGRGCPRGAAPVEVAKLMVAAAFVEAEIPALMPPVSKAAVVDRARSLGYTGDICGDCGNLTMVRNGTCLKCDSCGSTSGCS